MADVAAPPYRTIPIIPALKPGAMEGVKSFVASDKINEALGFPGQLVDDWHDRAIAKMGELLANYRSLKVYMDACVHCGACSDKCHYFIGTQDPKNMPVARQDLMRSVYRRYFTLPGKLFPKLVGARDLTREVLDEWSAIFTSVPNAAVAPCSALTESTPQKSPWRRARFSIPSATAKNTPTRSSARCIASVTTSACQARR